MYIANVTDYDKMSDDYNDNLTSNCTINENNIDILIPTLLLTIPRVLSFLCFLSLFIYILIKPLFKNK